jgi:trimethylamine:corrinoid methyltransferase-like protein
VSPSFTRNRGLGARLDAQQPGARDWIHNSSPIHFARASLRLLEALEKDGWKIVMTKWNVEGAARPVGVFDLTPPG